MAELVYVLAAAAILLPMLGAVVCLSMNGRASDYAAMLISAIAMVAGCGAAAYGTIGDVAPLALVRLPVLGEAAPGVATALFGLFIDPLSAIMLAIIVSMGLLVLYYSADYLSPRNREHPTTNGKSRYNAWMLLFIGSMAGIVLSPNFLQMFIFWEMTTLCSWALISFYGDERSLRAGYKALILTHIGGLGFIIAAVVLFTTTGSFGFGGITELATGKTAGVAHLGTAMAIFVLLAFAAWAKASQLPFYTWLPDAMAAPTPVSAYLHAAAMVKAGVYLMVRVFAANYAGLAELQHHYAAGLVLALMALLTMSLAVFLYFFQDDLKRLLAFSTISHLAYILLGVAIGILATDRGHATVPSLTGYQGGVLHIACHAVGKGLLFLTVGCVAFATGTRSIRALRGMGKRAPLLGVAFMVGVFAVTGVPPFSCFYSKFMLLTGALELGGTAGPLIAIVIVIESLLAFAWFLKVGHSVFLGEPSTSVLEADQTPARMGTVLVILIILTVVVPLVALPAVSFVVAGVSW